jgi:hypothetical protein
MKRALALAAALFAFVLSATAAACPVCAARPGTGILGHVALGAMILSPWAVAIFVGLWIRRAAKRAGSDGADQFISSETTE